MPLSFILIDENQTSVSQLVELSVKFNQINLVETFDSVKEARKFLQHSAVDFLIIDPNLSNELGFAFIEKEQVNRPIIILSSRTKDAVKAFTIGVFDFILKPLDKEKIFNFLDEMEFSKIKKSNNKIFFSKEEINILSKEYKMK